MTDAEMAAEMKAQTELVKKIGTETDSLKAEIVTLNQKVADLQAVIDGMGNDASPELTDAFNELKTQVGVVDAKVDDLSAPPPEG